MKLLGKILLATDFRESSAGAKRTAVMLAASFGSEILPIHVVRQPEAPGPLRLHLQHALVLAIAHELAAAAKERALLEAQSSAVFKETRRVELRRHDQIEVPVAVVSAVGADPEGEVVVADLRKSVFARIVMLPVTFFDGRKTGEITSRLTSDVAVVQSTVSSVVAQALFQGLDTATHGSRGRVQPLCRGAEPLRLDHCHEYL